ncbi:PhzF family isomerase [Variovorax sp. KBW07]|uniref:PhzF family isomerase n=1 Tax=Variovorax sp. KBW07 TaxID=2153358 RepID=UPI000F57E4AB|nr:PhzF family isomerase [Variovorax sp. KBW07]RQO63728.1 PhzF family isomerase [Variovorax sp. KBW07]
MTKQRTLFHVDAFTRTPFRGNPAGVVLNADGMSDEAMQDLARELKHSETAFVWRADADDHDLRIRYFTPTTEVPLCGHATIAAHFARATALQLGEATLRQKTGAGIQTVGISRNATGGHRIVMHQGAPVFEAPLEGALRERIVAALGLAPGDVPASLPVQVVSTGHSKVMVPLTPRVDLDALRPDMRALSLLSREIGCNGYFVFQQPAGEEAVTDGRMFAPAIGIMEDPVTGNANGPLGAYLVRHKLMAHDGRALRFQGRQGRALRRDGIVHVEVMIANGEPVAVSIAGDACILFSASLDGAA